MNSNSITVFGRGASFIHIDVLPDCAGARLRLPFCALILCVLALGSFRGIAEENSCAKPWFEYRECHANRLWRGTNTYQTTTPRTKYLVQTFSTTIATDTTTFSTGDEETYSRFACADGTWSCSGTATW